MKLVPLFDKVVLKQLVAEETTASGIVLPGAAKEKPQQAEVSRVRKRKIRDRKAKRHFSCCRVKKNARGIFRYANAAQRSSRFPCSSRFPYSRYKYEIV